MNKLQQRVQQRGQGGFTLIELLVVIAILAILAGVVVFAVGNSTENAKKSSCQTEKRAIVTAVNAVKAEGLTTPANVASVANATTAIGNYLQESTVASPTVTAEYFVVTVTDTSGVISAGITANGTAVADCNNGSGDGTLPAAVRLN